MMAQLSTAFSDLILAGGTLYGIIMLAGEGTTYLHAIAGFAAIFFSAIAGMFRFVLSNPPCSLVKIHRAFTWLGVTVGLSLIAAQFYYKYGMEEMGHLHVIVGSLLMIIKLISDFRTGTTLSEFVSGVASVSIMLINMLNQNKYGCFGGACLILVGLMVGTRGRRMGMPSVEMFHYGVFISILALTWALLEEPAFI